jgi:membrane protein implicated in regulation of membrane protease activity
LDTGLDHGGGGIFSVKPLTGFFLGFGWVGGIAMSAGLSAVSATACGFGAGAALMALLVYMFRGIVKLHSDGTMRISDAVGAVGTVYITLPPSKVSGGQVVVNFKGRQETFAALNNSESAISSGEKVKVIAVIDGQTVLVGPLA